MDALLLELIEEGILPVLADSPMTQSSLSVLDLFKFSKEKDLSLDSASRTKQWPLLNMPCLFTFCKDNDLLLSSGMGMCRVWEDDRSKDFATLICNIDEHPYPDARFLRLAVALVPEDDVAGAARAVQTLIWASAKNQAKVPLSSDLEKILLSLQPNLDCGFQNLVSTWEKELKICGQLKASIKFNR